MSDSYRVSGPQFRAEQSEQEAVRTTIVGGRPPGSGQPVGPIPRGIEVLIKKAAVDSEFCSLLLARRAAAAEEIGLRLEAAEAMMLATAPAEQLEAIIDRITVSQAHRRVFLGKAAAAMLAALGATPMAAAAADPVIHGVRPTPVLGTPPAEVDEVIRQFEVHQIIAKALDRNVTQVRREASLKTELNVVSEQFEAIHKALEERFQITLPLETLKKLGTVDEVIRQVEATREAQPVVIEMLARRSVLRGGLIEKSLSDDLKLTAAQLEGVRQDISTRLQVSLDRTSFHEKETVVDLIDMAATAVRQRRLRPLIPHGPQPTPAGMWPESSPIKGTRPDIPPGSSFGVRP